MKTRVNKTIAGITVALGSFFGSMDANAVCVPFGGFGSVIEYSTSAAAGTTFYLTAVNAILPPFAFLVFAPVGTTFHATLSDAQAAGQVVSVTGNAAVCPAAGAFRNAGTVTFVQRFDQ